MFDILVDRPKKRLYACLIVIGIILEFVLLLDLLFAFDVFQSSSFTDLLNLQNKNELSFFSYFFFSCLTSNVIYTNFSIGSFFSYIYLILQAFSIWDWFLIGCLVFLIISHRSAYSKITMCLLSGFFIGRILLLAGISFSLINVMQTNSAGALLNSIKLSSIVMLICLGLVIIGNAIWTIRLIKTKYLVLFREKDSI